VALRGRLTLMSALIVGVTLVLASVVAYVAVRGRLLGEVDDRLRGQTDFVVSLADPLRSRTPTTRRLPLPPPAAGGPGGYVQLVGPGGRVLPLVGEGAFAIPVTASDRTIAAGGDDEALEDRDVDGTHVRVLVTPLEGGGALQVARPLDAEDEVLARLRLVLVLLCVGGTGLAAVLSRLFSRSVVRPIRDLTETAEHIETTGDLGRRLDPAGSDEVGRMAAGFNAMLDRVQASQEEQRRLVADASHELRTPVTSLRTNVEVLRDAPELSEAERRALLDDVVGQADELGALVGDLMELARDGAATAPREAVRLDELVREALVRARRHAPGITFTEALEPCVVDGLPDRLGRAVNNLLDNAAAHSPPGATVEVAVRGAGELVVRDHGPGVPLEDAPHVFDRFYRGAAARGRTGSGLGLAIVKQVADLHGGTVAVEEALGGGALFRLRLPTTPTPTPAG